MQSFDLPPGEVSSLRGDVAIVGMACLFAGAPDLGSYWRNILAKVDSISDPPADEWDPKIFYDPKSDSNDRVYCKRAGYIGDLARFRPMDFGVMPVTVDGGEPEQWLALQIAHEALLDAGYAEPPKEHLRTEVILGKGTYVNRGSLTVGYHGIVVEQFLQALKNLHPEYTDAEILAIKKELKGGLPPFSADTAPALIGNIIAGRIANRLDLMGPSFTVDAACASALLAIEIGMRDLLSRKCDLVLAGGANVNAPLPTMGLFCQLGALSRQEKIRPFDKNADGTILGEGLGMIVLKRREDAERDGNRIYANIKGVGIASDGRAVHVMAPRIEGEELALRRAYQMAGVSPESIGLIEAHGTATPVGDVVEVKALRRVFGERKGSLPTCALGSVKSMIGHAMPAAGIAGVIKTALALYHRVLPPTLNCEEPNPALELDKTPFYVNTETRPWVHGGDTPRRAGVNSFGFGGINGHVVLEEHPEESAQPHSHQSHWETEVCVFEASSRQALIERCGQFQAFLARAGEVMIKDLAYTLNTQLNGQPSRVAIVAKSKEDLAQKLSLAMGRLEDPKCRQIKDSAGVYFFDQPLQGKLAFLFPGEGAQYPNMLLDLCVHFPELRRRFDLADLALKQNAREVLPSEFIFPRSVLSETEQSAVDEALWKIEGAVEGVLIANWAVWTLLRSLEIRPDAIVGHSTGDYSAMVASEMVALTEERYMEIVSAWNDAHKFLTDTVKVPEATLVAVAADASTVMSIADHVGGELYLAMDNCPHQTVLVGSKDAAERGIEELRRRGIIYELLPFDRPYHTPMFQAYAEGAGSEFFGRLPISAPTIETYSCTTASHYPSNANEIQQLFVDHWVRPVLFTQTVNQMYSDGVRLFIEVGPRGNLTAFVSDILRGRPHLAMPANVARRSGLTQLNHLVGVLAAQGVGMRLDYLYARRDPQRLAWESSKPGSTKPKPAPMKLKLALPPLRVAPRKPKASAVSELRGGTFDNGSKQAPQPLPVSVAAAAPPTSPQKNGSAPESAKPYAVARMDNRVDRASPPISSPAVGQPSVQRAASTASTLVMQGYLKGMEEFLDVETKVMEAFLRQQKVSRTGNSSAQESSGRQFPFQGTITSMVPGQELAAVRRLSLQEDLFLRDHALGHSVSLLNPELGPLVVLPLTMSMEILAEAAAALMPGQVLVGMRAVQAHHWIRVGESPVDLQISARRVADSSHEVFVQVRNLSEGNGQKVTLPVIEGIMVFRDAYAAPPAPSAMPLSGEQSSTLASATLYDGRRMFHGPCFQGVVSVDRSGQNGCVGTLAALSTHNLFRTISNPHFVTDPVVLDAAGQLVGFWAAEYLPRGFVVFPYHLEELRVYGPNRPVGELLTCRVNLQLRGNAGIRSDIEIAGADGRVWMQLVGWADRRFDPPDRFHQAWIAPRETTMSEPWQTPLSGLQDRSDFECYRLKPLFAEGDGFWKELWASLMLSGPERKLFSERRGPEHRQMEWLGARTAAKDAVRAFLRKHFGLELLPADIEITQDEHGKPIVGGSWTQHVPAIPELSLTHSEGEAVALVGDGSKGRHVGIDIQTLRELKPDFETLVLSADEQRLLHTLPAPNRTEWLLRLWSVKEAVSKALGRGLLEGPRSVRIVAIDAKTGIVKAVPQGKLAEVVPEAAGEELLAYTAREENYVVASALYEKRTS